MKLRATVVVAVSLGVMVLSCSDKASEPGDAEPVVGTWQTNFAIVYGPCLSEPPGIPPETVSYTSTVTFEPNGTVSVVLDPPCWGSTEKRCAFGGEPFTTFEGPFLVEGDVLWIDRNPGVPGWTEPYQWRIVQRQLHLFPGMHPKIPGELGHVRSTSVVWGDAFMKTPVFTRVR